MPQLTAKERTIFGKKLKAFREGGELPAVVYGAGGKAMPLSLSTKEFLQVWKSAGESTLVDLKIDGHGHKSVMIHEVEHHPVKRIPMHVDFYEARSDKPIRVHVPIEFNGESEAMKSLGGILVKILHEVEVEALPKDLPHEVVADLGLLKTFNDHISLEDIVLPKGVEIHGDKKGIVANVTPPRGVEELETKEVNLDEIEVVQKGKKEEEPTEEDE
ncbi:MAG: 50S ribosomal protein L25 [Patescibacteria group bacterium]